MRHFSGYALLIMLWNEFAIAEIETLWFSHIKIWGACFTSIFYVFSVWLYGLQGCFSCFSLRILLCNRQNIAEYEVYWLMGFPIINLWGCSFHERILRISVMAGWIAEILHAVLCLCNKHNIAEYEANWLISVPIINYWGTHQLFFLQSGICKSNN